LNGALRLPRTGLTDSSQRPQQASIEHDPPLQDEYDRASSNYFVLTIATGDCSPRGGELVSRKRAAHRNGLIKNERR